MQGNWKEYHAWSRSRQAMFDTCQRQFFYRYIKFYDVKQGDILKISTYMLNKMHNVKYLMGDIVHKTIELQFDQISRGREVPDSSNALKFIKRFIEDLHKNQKDFIIESMNGKLLSDDEVFDIRDKAKRQINIFFNEYFDFYKNLDILTHEDYCFFVIDEHKFWLKPDLISKSNDGGVYITDWKCDSTYPIDKIQMNLYILWALEKQYSNLKNLHAEVVFLDIGDSDVYTTNEVELNSFKQELVKNSTDLFNSIESKNNIDDFKKCDHEDICFSCGYKSLCKNNI